MFIIGDDKIINCDNVKSVKYITCSRGYRVIASYGLSDYEDIIIVNTKKEAKKALLAITIFLGTKKNLLFIETIEKIVAAEDDNSFDMSDKELLELFKGRNK